jgi:Pyridoxamine 5'-phosphate oxidase
VGTAPPRSREQRKADTLARLENSEDAWVASADADGEAYITPLSHVWDGATFVMATVESGLTGRNLAARDRVRFAIGETRDVIIVEGMVETFTLATVPTDLADAFATKLWDARRDPKPPVYIRVTPQRIQAWREVNELTGRLLMRDGVWLV